MRIHRSSAGVAASAYPPITLLIICALLHVLPATAEAKTMNDGLYTISNGNPASTVEYDTTYSRPGGQAEYFSVYSPPINTTYGEVYWRMMEDVPLPPDIVQRFDGKIMAVVGYEVDQVLFDTDGKGEEASVPITWAYNHHYAAFLSNNRKVRLVKQRSSGGRHPMMDHGSSEFWTTVPLQDDGDDEGDGTPDIPLSHFFSEANGGEMRLSYHGYPLGYAQLLDSPTVFNIQPMQIDTWNREAKTAQYKPGGPLPRTSKIPPSAGYSALIECPCSDRLEKKWWRTYELCEGGPADSGGINATECFQAARTITQAYHYYESIVDDPNMQSGCIITQRDDGDLDVQWNSQNGEAKLPSKPIAMPRMVEKSSNHIVAYASAQVNVTVSLPSNTDENAQASNGVTITIVGPADKWFAVGFGTDSMCLHPEADECPSGGAYSIVVNSEVVNSDVVNSDGQASVEERKLDNHGPGRVLQSSITVVSSTTTDANTMVVLSRAIQGKSPDHYTFDPKTSYLPIITARGCSTAFARHCGHAPSSLTFLPVDIPQNICFKEVAGTIGGNNFHQDCLPFPTSDLKVQKNPTCSIETYRGGLHCCRDGIPLLDKDQEVPWADQPLIYRLKFRFYFEECVIGKQSDLSHKSLVRLYWQTEANAGEYDIVQCPKGTPPSQCVQVITSRWQVKDMMKDCSMRSSSSLCTGEGSTDSTKTKGVKLIYAAPHCHAPSCISMDLYNADTGDLLCHVEPTFGKTNKVYDEHGFLALPPCLWGDEREGLVRPSLLTLNSTLLSIKKNNSTLGHTGEMASWQMRGVVVPNNRDVDDSFSSSLRARRG